MTLAGTATLVADAVRGAHAVGAFNVITLEHAEAIVEGAETAGADVILQVSQNAVRFHHGRMHAIVAACREIAEASTARVAIHLDHIDDPQLIAEALQVSDRLGVGSIMIDFATWDYDRNVSETASWAGRARRAGLWVEAEIGEVGGKDGAHAAGVRTDPGEATAFVSATGVDGLAVAVGSSHAMVDRSATLDLDLIARLAAAVPVPLVLHGSSGVADVELAAAVAAGIRKVNVGTALNVAGTAAVRAALDAEPYVVDPRVFTRAGRAAMSGVVAHVLDVLR